MISDKIIQKFLEKWKRKLKIKKKAMWLDDWKNWKRLTEQQRMKKISCKPFGAISFAPEKEPNFIFINKKAHGDNENDMENTIVHELIHLKHPNFPEKKVRKIANGIIPRKK